jgi:hypothetical protein
MFDVLFLKLNSFGLEHQANMVHIVCIVANFPCVDVFNCQILAWQSRCYIHAWILMFLFRKKIWRYQVMGVPQVIQHEISEVLKSMVLRIPHLTKPPYGWMCRLLVLSNGAAAASRPRDDVGTGCRRLYGPSWELHTFPCRRIRWSDSFSGQSVVINSETHRIHGAAINGNMDPNNVLQSC